jgi:hypothetical protein
MRHGKQVLKGLSCLVLADGVEKPLTPYVSKSQGIAPRKTSHGPRSTAYSALRPWMLGAVVATDRFDAVVVSHGASDPDGLQLARTLHEFMPRRPMLFATTSMIDVSADAVAKAGIAEILCDRS